MSAERQAGISAASKKDGPTPEAAAGQEQQQQPHLGGGRLAESGGTPLQSIMYFSGKAVLLLAVCWVLANYKPPRLLKTMLYSEWPCRVGGSAERERYLNESVWVSAEQPVMWTHWEGDGQQRVKGLQACQYHRDSVPLPLLAAADVSLWCGLSMGMDAPAALAGSALGLDISPHFDRPYASKSREFEASAGVSGGWRTASEEIRGRLPIWSCALHQHLATLCLLAA